MQTHGQINHTPLFCKPISVPYNNEILFISTPQNFNHHISFRSLQLDTDLDLIHLWVNSNHAQPFWQLAVSKEKIFDIYSEILNNSYRHSFIGLLNDKPICQVDIYRVMDDELSAHIRHSSPDDSGIHFMMAPVEQPVKDLSLFVFNSFHDFYFSFPMAKRLYGEPDKENIKANKLVRRAGFKFLKTVKLSYKTANLYCLHRDDFIRFNHSSK